LSHKLSFLSLVYIIPLLNGTKQLHNTKKQYCIEMKVQEYVIEL